MSADTYSDLKNELIATIMKTHQIPHDLQQNIVDKLNFDYKLITQLKSSNNEQQLKINDFQSQMNNYIDIARQNEQLFIHKGEQFTKLKTDFEGYKQSILLQLQQLQMQKADEQQKCIKSESEKQALQVQLTEQINNLNEKIQQQTNLINEQNQNNDNNTKQINDLKQSINDLTKQNEAEKVRIGREFAVSLQQIQDKYNNQLNENNQIKQQVNEFKYENQQLTNKLNSTACTMTHQQTNFKAKQSEYENQINTLLQNLENKKTQKTEQELKELKQQFDKETQLLILAKDCQIKQLQEDVLQQKRENTEKQELASQRLDQNNVMEIKLNKLQQENDLLKQQIAQDELLNKCKNQQKLLLQNQEDINNLRKQIKFQQMNPEFSDKQSNAQSRLKQSRSQLSNSQSLTQSENKQPTKTEQVISSYINNTSSQFRRKQLLKSAAHIERKPCLSNVEEMVQLQKSKQDEELGRSELSMELSNMPLSDIQQEIKLSEMLLAKNKQLEAKLNQMKFKVVSTQKEINQLRVGGQ